MALFIFLVLAFQIFFFLLLNKNRTNKSNLVLHLPPGPKGLPFIGNLHQLDYSALHSCLWKLAKKYGPLMSLRLGSKQVLVVSSAKMAEEVMKTHDLLFCSRPALFANQRLTYNGLDISFAPYNNHWREMRKICIVHLFSSNRVHSFQPIREFEVSQMIHNISETALTSEPVNLNEAMTFLTSTLICRIALGKKYDEDELRKFQELLEENEAVLAGFYVSDYFPSLGFFDKFNPLIHRLEKNINEFDSFYDEIIQEHLDPNRLKPEQEDLIDILLQIMKDSSSKTQLTFDHIKAVLMDVFVAGSETSAATVVWAMSLLMKNPLAMQKAQEEVRKVVGKKGFVKEEDTQKLDYMKAVIKETMRLQPVVPLLLPRESSQNCSLQGYDILGKTVVYVNVWAIGKDTQVWENPEEFCPERFMGNSVSIDLKGNDFELIPFGAGRRICPGISMGLVTVELALANLLYKFDWKMPNGMKGQDLDMEVQPGITVHRRNALCLMPTNYI